MALSRAGVGVIEAVWRRRIVAGACSLSGGLNHRVIAVQGRWQFYQTSGLWKPIVCDTVVVICVEMCLLACWSHVGTLCTPVG